jgi:hypothetical protein
MTNNTWSVSYSANYFTLNTTIDALNEDQAQAEAKLLMLNEYGIDLDKCGAKCVEVDLI